MEFGHIMKDQRQLQECMQKIQQQMITKGFFGALEKEEGQILTQLKRG